MLKAQGVGGGRKEVDVGYGEASSVDAAGEGSTPPSVATYPHHHRRRRRLHLCP
jgi:hypothetical protein